MSDRAAPNNGFGIPRLEWKEVVLRKRVKHPLRALRDERRLTQDELADLAGLSHVTLGKIENGRHVSMRSLRAVADALGVPVRDVIATNQAAVVETREELADMTNGEEVVCACETHGVIKRLGLDASDIAELREALTA